MAANDTTTTLNPGSGGDVMDESLVTQVGTGSGTIAKRQRVVMGGDAGMCPDGQSDLIQPINADPGANPSSMPVLATGIVNDTPSSDFVVGQLRGLSLTSDGRVRVASVPGMVEIDFVGDAAPDFVGDVANYPNTLNPWS